MEHDTNAAGSAGWGQDSVGIRSEKPKLLMPVRCTTRKFHVHHPPTRFKKIGTCGSRRQLSTVLGVVFRSTGTEGSWPQSVLEHRSLESDGAATPFVTGT